MAGRGQRVDIRERLARRTELDVATGCWVWTGNTRAGYGRISMSVGAERKARRFRLVHRVAFEALVGPIPSGLSVLHRCDNPPCCNPEHLFLGTIADNNRDRSEKGRSNRAPLKNRASGERNGSRTQPHRVPRGEHHGNASLTQSQADEMRALATSLDTVTLAARFGVHRSTVRRVVTGQRFLIASAKESGR